MANCTRFFTHSTCVCLFICSAVFSSAQSAAPLTRATPDGDIIIPVKTGILGQKDPGALAELSAHLQAVGNVAWLGMKGTGQITYATDDPTAYPATLYNSGMESFRLDAGTKLGTTSIRIHGLVGKIQSSDGVTSAIPPESAISGLFPFDIARRNMSSASASSISLFDRGVVVIGATSFHRISVESPSLGVDPQTHSRDTHVVDLYFDPASHLLAKSVVYQPVDGRRNVSFLFVVNYSDYRQSDSVLIPFHYDETMDGIPYSSLQLSTVQLNPTFTSNDFEF